MESFKLIHNCLIQVLTILTKEMHITDDTNCLHSNFAARIIHFWKRSNHSHCKWNPLLQVWHFSDSQTVELCTAGTSHSRLKSLPWKAGDQRGLPNSWVVDCVWYLEMLSEMFWKTSNSSYRFPAVRLWWWVKTISSF